MTTLTEQQRSKSIHGKKKKNGRAAKIALCNPFTKYWPRVNENDAKEIEKLLNSFLQRETGKVKLPWKKLSKLPKEIRKERINEINKNVIVPEKLKCQRNCLKLGLNAVSRAIQHTRVNSCLLAGDVQPEMIIQHLVTLAMTRGIPVLILPKLKEISCKKIGFSCIALGIMIEDDSYLKPLHEKILHLSSNFPLPPNYNWFSRKNEKVTVKKKLLPTDKLKNVASINTGTTDSLQTMDISTPFSSIANEKNVSEDFIAFSEEKDPMQVVRERPRIDFSSYVPPSYKLVPKNPNRIKRIKK